MDFLILVVFVSFQSDQYFRFCPFLRRENFTDFTNRKFKQNKSTILADLTSKEQVLALNPTDIDIQNSVTNLKSKLELFGRMRQPSVEYPI